MTKKTNELTPEQWATVRQMRDDWHRHGTSTAPADRAAAESAITEMYGMIGKPAPRFVWVDSPATAVLAIHLLKEGRDSLWDSLGASLGASLWDSLGDSLGASLGASLRDSLWDSLRDSLGDSLGDSLRASLGASLWDSLGASLGASLRASLWDAWWGQHEAGWIAFYLVPRELGLVEYDAQRSRQLDLWCQISQSCGWWWAYDGLCIVSERPAVVHMEPWPGRAEAAMRMHCADGPALRYRDGWEVYAWHGTRVPRELIMGEWTTADILREPNAEIRRCAIERMGWDRFVADANLTQVGDTMPDPGNPGQQIALFDVPERIYDEAVRVLICANATVERDGTRRRFGLTVPAHITDPVAAAAWTFDVDPDIYRQLARAC